MILKRMIINKMKKIILFSKLFIKSARGAIAVEASLVLLLVTALILYIAELCSVVYLSSAIDLAMSESMLFSSATTRNEPYAKIFSEKMLEKIKDTPLMYNKNQLEVSVKFCSSIEDIKTNNCSNTSASGKPIAIYAVKYKYEPLFISLPNSFLENGLNRSMIYVQEKGRSR